MRTYFDIETGPLPLDQLQAVMPEFVPAKNLKDPEKIAADVEQKRWDWLASAALRSTTGRILAVTIAFDESEPEFCCSPDEQTMIDCVIEDFRVAISQGSGIYSWNGSGFDLPFICQRAAVHGLPAFRQLTTDYRGRRSWNESFVDAMQVWCGPYNKHDGMSLKAVSATLGCGIKSGSGADFAALLASDPVKAKEYAVNDVVLLRNVVKRMGI